MLVPSLGYPRYPRLAHKKVAHELTECCPPGRPPATPLVPAPHETAECCRPPGCWGRGPHCGECWRLIVLGLNIAGLRLTLRTRRQTLPLYLVAPRGQFSVLAVPGERHRRGGRTGGCLQSRCLKTKLEAAYKSDQIV